MVLLMEHPTKSTLFRAVLLWWEIMCRERQVDERASCWPDGRAAVEGINRQAVPTSSVLKLPTTFLTTASVLVLSRLSVTLGRRSQLPGLKSIQITLFLRGEQTPAWMVSCLFRVAGHSCCLTFPKTPKFSKW